MRIGEAARATGVGARMLRYYECQGLVVPGRDSNNYRLYCQDGVSRARRVSALLNAGIPTRLIRSILNCSKADTSVSLTLSDDVAEELAAYAQSLKERATVLLDRRESLLEFLENHAHSGTPVVELLPAPQEST